MYKSLKGTPDVHLEPRTPYIVPQNSSTHLHYIYYNIHMCVSNVGKEWWGTWGQRKNHFRWDRCDLSKESIPPNFLGSPKHMIPEVSSLPMYTT